MSSLEQIQERRRALESMVQDCILAGVETPQEIAGELAQLAEAMKESSLAQSTPRSWTQWLGSEIDGHTLKRLIANDTYAYIFAAQSNSASDSSPSPGLSAVYKVAKAQILMTPPEQRPPLDNATMLIKIEPFDTKATVPDSNELIGLQQRRLSSITDTAVVSVSELKTTEGLSYYQMPFYKGSSLKDMMLSRAPNDRYDLLAHLAEAAKIIERLTGEYGFYHGNLKPVNILVTESGVKLSDLGYFGPLQSAEGWLEHAMVSSTAYYPMLVPDDLLALGIALFELLTGRHPFAADKVLLTIDEQVENSNLDGELLDEINFKRSVLEPYLTPLLKLERPAAVAPWIHGETETLLLKALRLNIDSEGILHKDPGFRDYTEFVEACQSIAALHKLSAGQPQAHP